MKSKESNKNPFLLGIARGLTPMSKIGREIGQNNFYIDLPSPYIKDMRGQKYNKLTILEFSHLKNFKSYWLCQCDCGNYKIILGVNIKGGQAKSCGCFRKPREIRDQIINGKKKCSKCKKMFNVEYFNKDPSSSCGLRSRCKDCLREYRQSERFKARTKITAEKWRNQNRERLRALQKKYIKNNPSFRIKDRKRLKRNVQDLKDYYVISKIERMGVPREDITPGMIELKRDQILLHREIKRGNRRLKNGTT